MENTIETAVEVASESVSDTPVNEAPDTHIEASTEPEVKEVTREERKAEIRAKALAAAAKREKMLREERRRLSEDKQKQTSEYETLRSQLEQQRQEFSQREKQIYQWMKSAKENPVEWLKENFEIDPERYYQRVMNDGKATPEEIMHHKLQAYEQELRDLRDWREKFENERKQSRSDYEKYIEQQKQEQQRIQQEQIQAQAQSGFLNHVSQFKGQYADLLLYPENVILQEAQKVARSLIEESDDGGQSLTFKDVADRLQAAVAAHHERIHGARAAKVSTEPVKQVSADNTKPSEVSKTPLSVPKTRRDHLNRSITLNSKMSERATIKGSKYEDIKNQLKEELSRTR